MMHSISPPPIVLLVDLSRFTWQKPSEVRASALAICAAIDRLLVHSPNSTLFSLHIIPPSPTFSPPPSLSLQSVTTKALLSVRQAILNAASHVSRSPQQPFQLSRITSAAEALIATTGEPSYDSFLDADKSDERKTTMVIFSQSPSTDKDFTSFAPFLEEVSAPSTRKPRTIISHPQRLNLLWVNHSAHSTIPQSFSTWLASQGVRLLSIHSLNIDRRIMPARIAISSFIRPHPAQNPTVQLDFLVDTSTPSSTADKFGLFFRARLSTIIAPKVPLSNIIIKPVHFVDESVEYINDDYMHRFEAYDEMPRFLMPYPDESSPGEGQMIWSENFAGLMTSLKSAVCRLAVEVYEMNESEQIRVSYGLISPITPISAALRLVSPTALGLNTKLSFSTDVFKFWESATNTPQTVCDSIVGSYSSDQAFSLLPPFSSANDLEYQRTASIFHSYCVDIAEAVDFKTGPIIKETKKTLIECVEAVTKKTNYVPKEFNEKDSNRADVLQMLQDRAEKLDRLHQSQTKELDVRDPETTEIQAPQLASSQKCGTPKDLESDALIIAQLAGVDPERSECQEMPTDFVQKNEKKEAEAIGCAKSKVQSPNIPETVLNATNGCNTTNLEPHEAAAAFGPTLAYVPGKEEEQDDLVKEMLTELDNSEGEADETEGSPSRFIIESKLGTVSHAACNAKDAIETLCQCANNISNIKILVSKCMEELSWLSQVLFEQGKERHDVRKAAKKRARQSESVCQDLQGSRQINPTQNLGMVEREMSTEFWTATMKAFEQVLWLSAAVTFYYRRKTQKKRAKKLIKQTRTIISVTQVAAQLAASKPDSKDLFDSCFDGLFSSILKPFKNGWDGDQPAEWLADIAEQYDNGPSKKEIKELANSGDGQVIGLESKSNGNSIKMEIQKCFPKQKEEGEGKIPEASGEDSIFNTGEASKPTPRRKECKDDRSSLGDLVVKMKEKRAVAKIEGRDRFSTVENRIRSGGQSTRLSLRVDMKAKHSSKRHKAQTKPQSNSKEKAIRVEALFENLRQKTSMREEEKNESPPSEQNIKFQDERDVKYTKHKPEFLNEISRFELDESVEEEEEDDLFRHLSSENAVELEINEGDSNRIIEIPETPL